MSFDKRPAVFMCDPCNEVTSVCKHLDVRIQFLEELEERAKRLTNVIGLLRCDHPLVEGGFCYACRENISKKL